MNRTEKLRQTRDVYTVAWREFLLSEQRGQGILYCFFEGEDNKYYIGRLNPILGMTTELRNLVCGGKEGVRRVNQLWSARYPETASRPRCLFFIDRDFDSRTSLKMAGMVYVTPCYSIENLYLTPRAVCNVLENEYGVHTEENVQKCPAVAFFEKLLVEFLEASTMLNAWIFLHRQYEAMAPEGPRLNLKNVKFNQLFSVTESGVRALFSESSLASLFPEASAIDSDELRRFTDWFRSTNRRLVFRGKYLIEFLRIVLALLKSDRCSTAPNMFSKKLPVKLGLSRENIVSELSQYAETPACLMQFINGVYS